MQDQQTPSPPPNEYDFLQTSTPQKSRFYGGDSKQKRIIIVAVGALVLIVLVFIIASVLQNANKPKTELLVSVLQDQQEIARIADIGSSKSKGSEALNYSTTLLETVRSDQKALLDVLGKSFKLPNKTLAAKQNKKTDELLTSAEQTNRLDEVVIETLKEYVQSYRTNLRAAYDGNSGQKTRAALQAAFDHTGFFINAATPDETGK